MDDVLLARRFGAIESQLRRISDHLGIDCPPFVGTAAEAPAGSSGLPAEVVELARAGNATQAISKLRALTGASLLEAKRAVDAL